MAGRSSLPPWQPRKAKRSIVVSKLVGYRATWPLWPA
jgi:hypothetical protein